MKKSTKNKEDLSIKDNLETKSFRKGDSVSYRPGNIKYKDTTIYRVSKENTVLRTVYDQNGNIRDIDCSAARIEELTRRNLELENSKKDKTQDKKEEFDSSFILYIVIAIVALGAIFIFFLFRSINQNAAVLKVITEKLNGGTT